jgi:hypothetical protein
MDYEVTYKYSAGKITARRRFIQHKEILKPEEYAAYKDFYSKVLKEDTRQILLTKGK